MLYRFGTPPNFALGNPVAKVHVMIRSSSLSLGIRFLIDFFYLEGANTNLGEKDLGSRALVVPAKSVVVVFGSQYMAIGLDIVQMYAVF